MTYNLATNAPYLDRPDRRYRPLDVAPDDTIRAGHIGRLSRIIRSRARTRRGPVPDMARKSSAMTMMRTESANEGAAICPTNNRYCLVRHGESEANVRGLISSLPEEGKVEVRLTDRGKAQARSAAEFLLSIGASGDGAAVVTSDFARARETAELIAAAGVGGTPVVTSGLRERRCPELHGRPAAEYRRRVWAADADPGSPSPDWETVGGVQRRMIGVVADCEFRWSGRLVVLVTHCDPARILLSWWLGAPVEHHFELAPFPVGGWKLLPPRREGARDMEKA